MLMQFLKLLDKIFPNADVDLVLGKLLDNAQKWPHCSFSRELLQTTVPATPKLPANIEESDVRSNIERMKELYMPKQREVTLDDEQIVLGEQQREYITQETCEWKGI